MRRHALRAYRYAAHHLARELLLAFVAALMYEALHEMVLMWIEGGAG